MKSKKLKPDEIVTLLTMTYKTGEGKHYDTLGGADLSSVFGY
jgi:hypothetical protein